ncbi:MAG: ABC transporter substrate-binding protein [Cellvibrionales bacterium]|nr:ABC transporter substrate-binding protein [Cellvibrionales bacterium]
MMAFILVVVVYLSDKVTHLPGSQLGDSKVVYLGKTSDDGTHSFPRQIIDPIGRKLTLVRPPVAIVSNILAGDEMLSQLVDQDRIRSVTYLADQPSVSNVVGVYGQNIPRSQGTIEEILSHQPDLVIIAAYSNATTVDLLLNTGVPVIRFANFNTLDDVRNNVRTLASALGSEDAADQWLSEIDEKIQAITRRIKGQPKPRVLYYNIDGFTSGAGSLMDETITLAGGRNVIDETGLKGYAKISPEMAIGLQPDVILMNDSSSGGVTPMDQLYENPAWQSVPAVKNKRVYGLHGAWVTSGSPYRVKGIEQVAHLLHPDVFKPQKTPPPDNPKR